MVFFVRLICLRLVFILALLLFWYLVAAREVLVPLEDALVALTGMHGTIYFYVLNILFMHASVIVGEGLVYKRTQITFLFHYFERVGPYARCLIRPLNRP